MKKKKIAVLGASGSIGQSTAKVLADHSDIFETYALAAKFNVAELARQTELLHPQKVITASSEMLPELQKLLPGHVESSCGAQAMIDLARDPEVDILLCAIIGTAGIEPVLAALDAGKTVALASKEVMVMAGELVNAALKASPGGKIIPVDSEHSGVFQCLAGRKEAEVAKLWLTASGGPFRTWEKSRIERATLSEALAHPTWSMGRKITIDSASMMNKVLELIEAKYLFNYPPEKLGVLVNPQSVMHAMVELYDGSTIAQLSVPDMRLAIGYALSYPERLAPPQKKLDLASVGKLEFYAPDRSKFPVFDFADEVLKEGGTLPAILNAANEVAVERFCAGEIPFGGIWKIVGAVLEKSKAEPQKSLEQLKDADARARALAAEFKVK